MINKRLRDQFSSPLLRLKIVYHIENRSFNQPDIACYLSSRKAERAYRPASRSTNRVKFDSQTARPAYPVNLSSPCLIFFYDSTIPNKMNFLIRGCSILFVSTLGNNHCNTPHDLENYAEKAQGKSPIFTVFLFTFVPLV